MIHLTESPREAFQAYNTFIPSGLKVRYIDALLKVGFDLVEIGSIVSPKLIPQMSDTLEVIGKIDFSRYHSKPMILLVSKKGRTSSANSMRSSMYAIRFPYLRPLQS